MDISGRISDNGAVSTQPLPAQVRSGSVALSGLTAAQSIVRTYLSGLKDTTQAAYRADLRCFASYLEVDTPAEAASILFAGGSGKANRIAHEWRGQLLDDGYAPTTVNRRLSALRSVTTTAYRTGHIGWTLSVAGVKSKPYRDTTGPGLTAISKMLNYLNSFDTPKAARDRAILRLMFDLGLRRGEIAALNACDVDLDAHKVSVVAKGQREPQHLTLASQTCEALNLWLSHRGTDPGPLFTNLHRSPAIAGTRLTDRSIARNLKTTGEKVGVDGVRPHGIRHSAITTALDATGGNVRAAKAFSRHAKLDTLSIYDDNRQDTAGQVTRQIADLA